MVRILSIETSGNVCSVSISKDSDIMIEQNIYLFNKHDKLLAEMIRRTLNDVDMKIESLDAVAVSSGPGSFTGLRIGAAIAKGICYGEHPKLIAVPTLSSLAYSASRNANLSLYDDITAVIPSHKKLIYSQKFNKAGKSISEIEITEIDNFKYDNNSFICGPGKEKLSLSINRHFDIPKASLISELAFEMYKSGIFEKSEDFSPMYVQEFIPK